MKYTANLKSTCPSRKCPQALSRVRCFLWLFQHLQTSCQALHRLIQPLLVWSNPLAWKVVFSDRDEDQDGKRGRFFLLTKDEKEDALPREGQALSSPLSLAHIQEGLPRLQKGTPVQRAHLTCDQTEAQGFRGRASAKNKAFQSPVSLGQQGQSGGARGNRTGDNLGEGSTTCPSFNCLFCFIC